MAINLVNNGVAPVAKSEAEKKTTEQELARAQEQLAVLEAHSGTFGPETIAIWKDKIASLEIEVNLRDEVRPCLVGFPGKRAGFSIEEAALAAQLYPVMAKHGLAFLRVEIDGEALEKLSYTRPGEKVKVKAKVSQTGNSTRAWTIEGQTYASARAACEALGLEVGRDSAVRVLKRAGYTQ